MTAHCRTDRMKKITRIATVLIAASLLGACSSKKNAAGYGLAQMAKTPMRLAMAAMARLHLEQNATSPSMSATRYSSRPTAPA